MSGPPVLVVGETPSLGRAIQDLLEAYAISARLVSDLDPADRAALRDIRVIVAAANSPQSRTLQARLHGHLRGPELVVVGSRDAPGVTAPGIHPVGLPLVPAPFVQLVRALLAGEPRG